MRISLLVLFTVTVFTASGVLADKGGAASQPADGIVRRGLPLSKKAALSVSKVISQAQKHAGNYVKVTGAIKSVCKKKGCWFVIKDLKSNEQIRITSLGYKFFVPKDCEGQTATVEGQFEVKTMSVAEGQHLEDDKVDGTGKKAKKVTKKSQEYRLASIGVELKK